MHVLWELGEATGEKVRQALPDKLHDSTVRTILRILEGKGCVRRAPGPKSYVYKPRVTRAAVEKKTLRTMLKRFFGGSAESLVVRLIEDNQLSPEQFREIARRLKGGSPGLKEDRRTEDPGQEHHRA